MGRIRSDDPCDTVIHLPTVPHKNDPSLILGKIKQRSDDVIARDNGIAITHNEAGSLELGTGIAKRLVSTNAHNGGFDPYQRVGNVGARWCRK